MRALAATVALLGVVLAATPAGAKPVFYAIAIGNNAPPRDASSGSPLSPLRYADDDAVRYFQFFARFADNVRLLTITDMETQRRYPDLPVSVPTLSGLTRIVHRFATSMQTDLDRGDTPILFLAFSGHGARLRSGEAFLTMVDGPLTRRYLHEEVLAKLPATYAHLFIDACHAEAIVGGRGAFDREAEARSAPVTEEESRQVVERTTLARFPHVGVMLAATADQETHEWSRIESGIFTHELLSGLTGAADVNGDARVEYSELQAFIASANRDIKDPRAIPKIVAMAPPSNPRTPILDLSWLRDVRLVTGDPSALGHFYIELEDGQRYLDANLRPGARATFALPASRRAFLVAGEHEAEIASGAANTRVPLASLKLRRRELERRGSVDASYRAGLFQTAYGPVYYKGFVDSAGLVGVSFLEVHAPAPRTRWTRRHSASVAAFGVSGLALVGTTLKGIEALDRKGEVEATTFQRPAADGRERFIDSRRHALLLGGAAVLSGVAGWWLWPSTPHETQVSFAPAERGGFGLVATGVW